MHRSRADLQVAPRASAADSKEVREAGCPHLIVLLEDAQDAAWLANRTLDIAQRQGLDVLLLGLAINPSDAAGLRRQLVTMAAFIRQEQERMELGESHGARGHAPEIEIVSGRDWLGKIKARVRAGDIIACSSAQTVGSQGRPLNDVLTSNLSAPIYVFATPENSRGQPGHLVSQIVAWAFSLASIGGFLMLQMQIAARLQGWPQSSLLLLTMAAEVAWIWLVNSLLGTY